MERHEGATEAYEAAGLQILELAQNAYSSYVTKNPREQARLVKTVVSNSTFDRGSLSPTYIKPFDVFANGGDWLLRLDSNKQPPFNLTARCPFGPVASGLRQSASGQHVLHAFPAQSFGFRTFPR